MNEFTIMPNRINYSGIKFTKEVKNLCTEKYKTLMKEIKADINKWKDTLCSQIGVMNIVKIPLEFRMTLFSDFILLLFIDFFLLFTL